MKQLSKNPNLDKIVKKLQTKKTMTYTEIKKELKITDRAISRNLTYLLDEGTIEFTKEGREKHYRLSKNVGKIFERKIDVISSEYEIFCAEEIIENISNEEELFKKTGNALNALMQFALIKSIETGQNWLRMIDLTKFSHLTILELGDMLEVDKKDNVINITTDMQTMDNFKVIQEYVKNKNLKNKVDKFYRTLRKIYPKEIKALENSLKKGQST